MLKALIVTTVSGFVQQFELNNVKLLQKYGYEVHYASNYNNPAYGSDNKRLEGTGIIQHQVDFARSPFSLQNVKAYHQLKELLKTEKFDIIHCHTPVGGAVARLVGHKYRRQGTKIVYTAHGFHFFRGAPLLNWILFYPVEKFLAGYTDALITINKEDYEHALGFKTIPQQQIYHINGVGINTHEVQMDLEDNEFLKSLINPEDLKDKFILLSVGELSKRKNQDVVIKALQELKTEDPAMVDHIIYIIAGKGKKEACYRTMIQTFQLEDTVKLVGYQTNVTQWLKIADLFVFPSRQEGLSVALLEAMRMGKPVVASDIRGNNELIDQNRGGYLADKMQVDDYKRYIQRCYSMSRDQLSEFGIYNKEKVRAYDIDIVSKDMEQIYQKLTDI